MLSVFNTHIFNLIAIVVCNLNTETPIAVKISGISDLESAKP